MPEPIPSPHSVGDVGHTIDHNNIVQTLDDYQTQIGSNTSNVAALQAAITNMFSVLGGNACPVPGASTSFAQITIQAVNRDSSPDVLDVFYGTQKIFSLNGYGEVRVSPALPSHVAEIITLMASQTADAWQIQNSGGTAIVRVDSAGNFYTNKNIQVGTSGTPGLIQATQPVSGGPETWHAFNPLQNSWSVPSGGFAQYRLTPMNELQISALIRGPGGSTVNGVTIAQFASQYWPQSLHSFPVASTLYTSVNNATPMMSVSSTGLLQAQNIGGNPGNATVSFEVKIPRDI